MTTSVTTETEVQKALSGATVPDVTNRLSEILKIALMVPNGNPNDLYSVSEEGELCVNADSDCTMGVPLLLWGLSGIGKSGIIKNSAKAIGLNIRKIFPATRQPEDFSDVPVVIDNKLMSACMLAAVNNLNELCGGVLNIDEVSCGTPATQGAMLSMLLDRLVGSTRMHPCIRMILAANPPAYAAGGWALEAPFSNRMAHGFVRKQPKDKLIDYILSEGQPTSTEITALELRLIGNWNDAWARAKGLWVGFLSSAVGDAVRCEQPDPSSSQASYCWPSDRTWEMAFRSIATIRALGFDPELEPIFMRMLVGEAATTIYETWAANSDLPEPMDALKNGFKLDIHRLDKIMAVYSGMFALIVNMPIAKDAGAAQVKATKQRRYDLAALGWNRLEELCKIGLSDIAGKFARMLVDQGLSALSKDPGIVEAADPVLRALKKSPVMKYLKEQKEV